jgi:hypothetical protein
MIPYSRHFRAALAARKDKKAQTFTQKTKNQEQITAYQRKFLRFRELQSHHMPGLHIEHVTSADPAALAVSIRAPLYLPSGLTSTERSLACPSDLPKKEANIRFAQATDALENLRNSLRLRSVTIVFKRKNITGQGSNTRAKTYQMKIERKIQTFARTYRRARAAYLNLVGPGEWEHELRTLNDTDIRGLDEHALHGREEDERLMVLRLGSTPNADKNAQQAGTLSGRGESRRTVSWIWYRVGTNSDLNDTGLHNGTVLHIYYFLYLICLSQHSV